MALIPFVFALSLCLSIVVYRTALLRKLPPGPSLLTRLADFRKKSEPLPVKFWRWSNRYGPVVSAMDYARIGSPTIVLGTAKAALDLLDKRGNIYSSRPRNIIGGEIASENLRGALMSVGTEFKRFRTIMTGTLGVSASKQFRSLEDVETKLLMKTIVSEKEPEKYHFLFRQAFYSVAVCTAYGYRIPKLTSTFIKNHGEIETFFLRHFIPGSYLVDHFPALLRLPRWLQWFRTDADKRIKSDKELYSNFFARSKKIIEKDEKRPGAAMYAMSKQEQYGLTDTQLAYFVSAPYTAGITTTLGTFESFILAMALYPDVLKKAQDEIDSVVGDQRMPDFQDEQNLPYIQAIVKESLRWHPFLAVGLPHTLTEDDVYENMFIPKGSTVIGNVYGITRDPELFPEPEEFRPERFFKNEDPLFKSYNLSFGFGRRICPGQYVATDQLFLLISRIVWAFDLICNKPEEPLYKCGPPPRFSYVLVPRSEAVVSVIKEEALEAEKNAKNWE